MTTVMVLVMMMDDDNNNNIPDKLHDSLELLNLCHGL
jgi:hypothetical protein